MLRVLTLIQANYRRASANMALGKFKEALKDLRVVSKRAPSDKDAKAKFDDCAKIVRRIEFEKAIEVQNTFPNLFFFF